MNANSSSPAPGGGDFPTTQWTVVVDAVSSDPVRAREALERLCTTYREPIVQWFRRRDYYQEPEDLTHSYVAYVIEKDLLTKVAPRTGQFRAFLRDTMRKFLWDTWDKANAQKRGAGIEKVSLTDNDVDAEAAGEGDSRLDVDFAFVIHRRVMKSLSPAEELRPYIFLKDSNEGWNAIAARRGKTSAAVRQEAGRLRRAHWERFQAEVAQIVAPAHRAEETRYLYEVLFRNSPPE